MTKKPRISSTNKTGNVINIRREQGVFVVDAFVDLADPTKNNKGQVFTRPT